MTQIHEEEATADTLSFSRLTSRHEPTLFRGLARSWLPAEAYEGASVLDWLSRTIGHRIVPFSVGLPGDAGFMGNATVAGGTANGTTLLGRREFHDIAREMSREVNTPTGHLLYVQSLPLDTHAPELKNLPKIPEGTLPAGGHWRAWIGTGSHYGYLHVDGSDNFFCVLAGQKTFLLCPFDVLPDIYIGPLEGGAYKSPASMVDPLRPDLTKFPRFARALEKSVTVTLNAGDVLYLPCGWWHCVESSGFNFSVNYWWYDIPDQPRSDAEALFMRALLSLRPLPRHWREFWKVMLDTFVFRMDGEPFEHMVSDEQGFAGVPTPERILFLRSQIAQMTAAPEHKSVLVGKS